MSDINDMHKAAYVRHLESLKRSKNTITSYSRTIDDFSAWMDYEDILEAEKPDLQDYFGHLLKVVKDTSVCVEFRNLRALYNWAVREEIIERSPMATMKAPKITDIPPDLATDEELAKLLKVCSGKSFLDRRDTAIIRLLNEPGAPRREEMTSILLANVDMRANKIDILGKGDKWRTIFFGHKTGQALDRYLRARAKHKRAHLPHLFLGERGMELTMWGLRPMLIRRCKAAGIRALRPHQIRHTTYHAFRMAGGSADDGEVLFGWSPNSRMDQVYGRSMKIARAEQSARRHSIADRF